MSYFVIAALGIEQSQQATQRAYLEIEMPSHLRTDPALLALQAALDARDLALRDRLVLRVQTLRLPEEHDTAEIWRHARLTIVQHRVSYGAIITAMVLIGRLYLGNVGDDVGRVRVRVLQQQVLHKVDDRELHALLAIGNAVDVDLLGLLLQRRRVLRLCTFT